MAADKRTRSQLKAHIVNLEKENRRLTDERDNAINALTRWKDVHGMKAFDSLDELTIKAMKAIMQMSDKVRTRF